MIDPTSAACRLATRQRQSIGFRITRGGTIFLIAATLIGLAAIDANINLLVLVFGLCTGALLINAFHGWRTLRALSIRRVIPDCVVAGQSFVIRYTITNHRRWFSARSILIEEEIAPDASRFHPEAFVLLLRPGEMLTLLVPAVLTSRGRKVFSRIKLSSRYPFHLCTKWIRHTLDHEVIVFPPLCRLISEISPRSKAIDAAGGSGAIGYRKGEEDYYGVREFRDGDNPRWIHWRHSARTGQLIIREMAQTRSRQIWCVIHTQIDNRDKHKAQLIEQALSAAATLICDALERGMRIGLICTGDPPVVLPPATGRPCRPRLLRELALCTTHPDNSLASLVHRLAAPTHWHGPCLLFGAADNETMQAAAAALSRCLGPTTLYVPGSVAFDNLFQPVVPAYSLDSHDLNPQTTSPEMAGSATESN